jgi:hypothetical protein
VDITVYSLVLPSSLFGVVREEYGRTIFVANCCQPVRAGGEIKVVSGAEGFEDEEEILLKNKGAGPLGFAQSLKLGLRSGASGVVVVPGLLRELPQVDPLRRLDCFMSMREHGRADARLREIQE